MFARALRLSLFAWLACGALLAGAQEPERLSVRRIGDAVVFEGRIDAAAAATFLALLQAPGVRRVVITSGGGLVDAALDMAEAIHARGLDLEVPRACLSSCANYIFPAARHKRLGHPDAVGWHGNMTHVLFLHRIGRGGWSEAQMQSARLLAWRESAFFRSIGVDGFVCWIGKLPPYDVYDFYALSPRDMARFGIHGVTVDDPAPVNADAGVRRIVLPP